MEKYNTGTGETEMLSMTLTEIMLMCSLLCSTDVIAAVSIVKYSEKPKLYSIIFGEGVINDAVVIIIFNTITTFTQPENVSTPLEMSFLILLDFTRLLVFSTLVGIFVGMLCGWFLKHMNSLRFNPIYESGTLLCFG